MYERSLAIREKAMGPKHPDVAQSLNNLAELSRAQVMIECFKWAFAGHSRAELFLRIPLPVRNPDAIFAGQLRKGRSVVRAIPGHERKGLGSRASRGGPISHQSGGTVEGSGASRTEICEILLKQGQGSGGATAVSGKNLPRCVGREKDPCPILCTCVVHRGFLTGTDK